MADARRKSNDPSASIPTPRPSADAERDAASYVTARRRETSALPGENEGLYRLLVESVQDYAIFALDVGGHVASWNLGAQRLKGYQADEIIGSFFGRFYPAELVESRFPQYELEVAAREGRFEDEGWRIKKDGSRFWANVVITALRDREGKLVGYAKVTRDLTERRAAEERAIEDARALADSQATSRAKTAFLAAMSHELRTPLNAIGGYAELLAMGIGGPVTAQQQQYIERIRNSQQHLLAIINDILNFSRIEAGQLDYAIEDVAVDQILDSVMRMIEPQAIGKKLDVRRRPANGARVRADRLKAEQILLNLLSNAVKFTEEGGLIEVSVDAPASSVVIHVCDTGIGIPEDQLESIFEPFVQVGRSHRSQVEGTGLGLAISRDLARAMQGDLVARSTVGEGSTFSLSLPAA